MTRRIRAFTLIELLVVVSIIALLVSILLPALSKARIQAQRTVCINNVRSISMSAMIYAVDYNGYTPPVFGDTQHPATPSGYFEGFPYWLSASTEVTGIGYFLVEPYNLDPQLAYCPLSKGYNKYEHFEETWLGAGAPDEPFCYSNYSIHYTTRLEGANVALVADIFHYGRFVDQWNHFWNHEFPIDEFSVAYSDGSARCLDDPYQVLRYPPPPFNQGEGITNLRQDHVMAWDMIMTPSYGMETLLALW